MNDCYFILVIGEYTLNQLTTDTFMLTREGGEGLEIGKKELERLFENYFKDNF